MGHGTSTVRSHSGHVGKTPRPEDREEIEARIERYRALVTSVSDARTQAAIRDSIAELEARLARDEPAP
jgi:hypothetical protein